jgi:2-oxoglutarate dehydrogenase E2 component (dihydrolipoamide succinyltransferase)
MAETKVIMPQLGESIFEGTLTKWLKKKGDRVERDEPLFEMSTDKVDSEIPAPAAGILQDVLVQEGQTVQINTVVAVIADGAPATAEAAAPPSREEPAPQPAVKLEEPVESKEVPVPAGVEVEDIRSSPLVRRIAREHGIGLVALAGKGTGISGRITKRDILSYIEQGSVVPRIERPRPAAPAQLAIPAMPAAPASAPAPPRAPEPAVRPAAFTGGVERVPMTPMRKSIAEHMALSRRTAAHVTTFFEVDCSRVLRAREILKPDFERSGGKLTVTPFFVLAAANALKRFPVVNSSLDGDTIVYKRDINIGIAVNLDWGLIVPVVKHAAEKNLMGLARAINDLGERARRKKLTPDDVQDGTFTITNPGPYGGLTGTPIINQPQVAIMAMGGIKKRAIVIDDAIAIRSMIILSLSFDHRVMDGAVADQFMADIQKQLENWQV